MLHYQVEDYELCEPELCAIYPRHYEELTSNPDIPLRPRYDVYERLAANDMLLLVTVRDGSKMVGYFLGIVAPELHYETCLSCTTDIFFVEEDYRQRPGEWVGVRMFRTAEAALRQRGVMLWRAASKDHRPSTVLLRRMGFKPSDTSYSKRLA